MIQYSVQGVCKMCGCTDTDCRQCIEKTGQACRWTSKDQILCTACVDEFCATTLLNNLELMDESRGLCHLTGVLRDNFLITIHEYYLIRTWLYENLPEAKYSRTYAGTLNYSWPVGDIDSRYYWLKLKLENIKDGKHIRC